MTPRWNDCLPAAAAHVQAAYPHEGCGLVLEVAGAYSFQPLTNLAPNAVASHRFALDPREILRAHELGARVVAFVHSHADGDEQFSAEDVRAALTPEDPPRPWYPDVDHLVVSVTHGVARTAALYRFDPHAPGYFARVWRFDFDG